MTRNGPAPRRAVAIAAILAAGLSTGCSYLGTARAFDPEELGRDPGWIRAAAVPPILQQARKDCGAAALAMVFAAWQAPCPMEEIVQGCPAAPERGIKAGALRDFALKRGFQAFLFEGTTEDLERELRKRRPVIAGLVKPHLQGGMAHYEVVVAIHPDRGIIVTLDPARGWRKNSIDGFKGEWEAAGRLTLVVIGRLPE